MPERRARRIGLGTVQWGQAYGIANRLGRPALAQVAGILARARALGISLLDTAAAYGEAEETLGGIDEARNFDVVTKTLPYDPAGDEGEARLRAVMAGVDRSLALLKRQRVHGLLVHHADELLSPHGGELWKRLEALKAGEKVDRLGVSVYEPRQLERLLDRFPIELVQLPFNIYDQRFARSGLLARLKRQGVEVHVRSVLLQGALAMAPAELPGHLAAVRPLQARWQETAADRGLTPLAVAIGFCLGHPEVDRVILGCESIDQLEGLVRAAGPGANLPDLSNCHLDEEVIIDPRRWPRARP